MVKKVGLNSIINESFVNRFTGLASEGQKANALGGGQQASISSGLRRGAQTFATSTQVLNSAISFVNSSDSTLGSLEEITDDLITLAERATNPNVGQQERRRLDVQYRKLANDFEQVLEGATLGELDLLKRSGFESLLNNTGLTVEDSPDIAAFFDQLALVSDDEDGPLADPETQGEGRALLPAALVSAGVRRAPANREIFAAETTLTTRADAYEVLHDLKALSEQIKTNRGALEELRGVLDDNLVLARETGLAFLEVGDRLDGAEEADEVARDIRALVRRNAGPALAQAANLEPLVVAALLVDESTTTQ